VRENGSLAGFSIATIRTLAMDAVQKADSGHRGAFLTITRDPDPDLAVPGRRASFGTVQIARARGDGDALAARGWRVLRVDLKKGGGIDALKDAVFAAL
jgi:hypothetical protein